MGSADGHFGAVHRLLSFPAVCGECGTLDEEITRGAKEMAPTIASGTASPDVFSPMKVVEIATEADGEYTQALGGSANANNDILGVMNGVQAIYQRDIGLTFTVVFQHTWTDPAPRSMNSTASRHVLMPPMPEIGMLKPSTPAIISGPRSNGGQASARTNSSQVAC